MNLTIKIINGEPHTLDTWGRQEVYTPSDFYKLKTEDKK